MPKANPYEEAAKKAVELTNREFASEISSLSRLKDEEINRLFPKKEDKQKLLELLRIVNASTSNNQKITKLKQNIGDVAEVVIKLVGVLV